MNKIGLVIITSLIVIWGCNTDQESKVSNSKPLAIETTINIISIDSIEKPEVITVDRTKLKKIKAGEPKILNANNIYDHKFEKPKIVPAGKSRVCTPGKDTFDMPRIIIATGQTEIAGAPDVVVAKEPYFKDPNPKSIVSYNIQQGLNDDAILCQMQDKCGNIWFGDFNGCVSKFDGKYFYHFRDKSGLRENTVRGILEDKKGNIWFGTGGGPIKYDGKYFTHYPEIGKLGLYSKHVQTIIEDSKSNIWFGTYEGLIKYDGISFTHFTEKSGLINNEIWSIMEDKFGNLWIGTVNGACKFDGTSFTHFTENQGLINNKIWSIIEDKFGNLWIGTENGACKFDGTSFTHFTENQGLRNNKIWCLFEDKTENIWFGTDGGGVSKYDGKNFTNLTVDDGLSYNRIRNILEDNYGNLWFGTFGNGISKYNNLFVHYGKNAGLTNYNTRKIIEDKKGNLWIVSVPRGGLIKFDGKLFTNFTEKEGLINNYVSDLLEDSKGDIWISYFDGGISQFNGKEFIHYTKKNGLIDDDISCILEDNQGKLWIGSSEKGISVYNGETFSNYTNESIFNDDLLTGFIIDKFNNIWLTGQRGFSKFDGNILTHFTPKIGLTPCVIYSALIGKNGDVWFSTNIGGVSLYDGKSFLHLSTKQGKLNNNIDEIFEDSKGNMWFSSKKGLEIIRNKNLLPFIKKVKEGTLNDDDIFVESYVNEDGLQNTAVISNLYEDSNENLYISNNDRVSVLNNNLIFIDSLPPNIQITDVDIFNDNIDWIDLENKKDTTIILGNGVRFRNFDFDSTVKWYGVPQGLSLASNNNYVTFRFVGITQNRPHKVKYKYRLTGLNDNWSALTDKNEAQFGNLPYGNYTFIVKSMNAAGLWSEPLAYQFSIRPPWYFTWWAFSIYLVLILLASRQIHLYQKAKTIRKERERAQQKELEQAKEIEKAYSELKSTQAQLIQSEKMASLGELTAGIAHEIQNPLNFVNNFSEVSNELIKEMKEEFKKGDVEEGFAIADDLEQNLEKINHHGKRASSIVKGMLEHSRTSSGKKEPTDINALVDEYLRLAYHGLRAKDKEFNATMETQFDPNLPKIEVVPQDIGRVLINIITNAFYAVNDRSKKGEEGYVPTVSITTKIIARSQEPKANSQLLITITDNGSGIPQHIKDKIFQPFFTTKPTGQGTGLGLSLAYDIVKAHGGELKVESKVNEGSEFVIVLPL